MSRLCFRKRSTFTGLVALASIMCLTYIYWTIADNRSISHSTETIGLSYSQKKKLQWRRISFEGERAGKWTRHIWLDICGNLLYSLRKHRNFPLRPDKEMSIKSLSLRTNKNMINFGERIFGYIHPYSTGFYRFVISGYDTSELWISTNDDPYNVLLYSYIRQPSYMVNNVFAWYREYNKFSTQLTKSVYLKEGQKYFIDILHKQGQLPGHLSIQWKGPGMNLYEDISASSLSLYDGTSNIGRNITWKRQDIPSDLPSTHLSDHDGLVLSKEKFNHRENMYKLPLLKGEIMQDMLPACPYSPTYIVKKKIKRYSCYDHIVPTQVFPRDDTWIADFRGTSVGNKEIQLFVAQQVNRTYTTALMAMHGGRFRYKRMLNLEQRIDENRGEIYLIELELELNRSKDIKRYGSRTARISQYVYRYLRNQSKLCFPDGMQWNHQADVYAIVCVYNQGAWVKHFIKQMVQFQKQAKGYSLHVIVVDHHSTDLNITKAMLDSELKSYTVIQRQGIFWKTAAIQAAIDTIKDPHSIVLMLDLHLYFPSDFIDIIRKHSIEGKLAAAPMLIRLHCGYSKKEINGFWEIEGLGIFGIYKSDLDRIGGINTRDYKGKWGGEDVELVDRAIGFGLEVSRIKIPKFYHQYHSRKGMWDKNSLPSIL